MKYIPGRVPIIKYIPGRVPVINYIPGRVPVIFCPSFYRSQAGRTRLQ